MTKRTSNCENMIDHEHLLVTFNELYKIPIVLLVVSDSQLITLVISLPNLLVNSSPK